MSLHLCVDCGGSKTSAVICNASGTIVGRALSGPSNFAYLGLDAFIIAVRDTVGRALQSALAPPSPTPVPLPPPHALFAAAWFGVSGVDSSAAVEKLTPALGALLGIPEGGALMVANDTHLVAAPVRMRGDVVRGVVCIAGTGSACMSFEKQRGRLEVVGRAGGWGWILGDEGGGFHVGREAVREVLRERDEGRGVTGLREAVLAWFGVSEVLEILPMVYMPDSDAGETGMSREKRLSSLAPVVFKAGFEAGDEAALAVLRRCSGLLVVQICVLLGEKVKADECALCLGGSLLGVGGYRDMVLAALRERGHVFKHVEYVEDAAAVGAVALCTQ